MHRGGMKFENGNEFALGKKKNLKVDQTAPNRQVCN